MAAQHGAAFPSVASAIVTVASAALSSVRVVRGRDFSQDPGDVVMVGVRDLEDAGTDSAGTFQQTIQTFGGSREEVGEVNALVAAWNGQADQDAACITASDYLASIEAAVRADPTLGLSVFDYVDAELSAGDVTESQNNGGATSALSFTIAYKIRI